MRRLGPLIAATLPLAAQWATFHAAYEEGLALQRRGDHGAALRAFGAAIALRPEPAARVKTYGLNFLFDYHPYLRSAESALALGDLDRADQALTQSERFAVEPSEARARLRERLLAARVARAPKEAPPPNPPVVAPAKTETPSKEPTQSEPARVDAPPSDGTPLRRAPQEPRPSPPRAPRETHVPSTPDRRTAEGPSTPTPSSQPPTPGAQGRLWVAGSIGLLLALGAGLWARRRRSRRANPYRVDIHSLPEVTQLSSNRIAEMPSRRGPYRILRILGRGGCATTYLAEHTERGENVALKIPHPHILLDEDFRHRFHREASLGLRLHHPRIVRILDAGAEGEDPWMAMELVRGTTLDTRLREQGPLSLPQIIRLGLEVAEALAYAHAQGVVHRDLKPANLMLGEEGVTVMDFGIARLTEGEGLTTTNVFLGTPTYAAPESLRTPRVGPAADRYALGIILFELLAGGPPFTGATTYEVLHLHQVAPLPPLDELRPGLDPRLVRLIQRLCHKPPQERPEDPEVIQILRDLAAAHPL